MSDYLSQLPEIDEPISPTEMNILNEVFSTASGGGPSTNSRALLIYGLLFFSLNLPIVDSLMKGMIETNNLILLAIKTLIFLALIWVFQLMNLF